ncbi:MAG: hypothetical protein RLZZ148_198 [Cyanobacteriota bacterium]|jgi:mRNA interferase MazF
MAIKKGDIVLVPFPFTDLSTTKIRPAVVLWVDSVGTDITVCFISSQNINNITSEEFIIEITDSEFSQTGLRVTSKVRVSRVATIESSLITKKLGKLETNLQERLDSSLRNTFQI